MLCLVFVVREGPGRERGKGGEEVGVSLLLLLEEAIPLLLPKIAAATVVVAAEAVRVQRRPRSSLPPPPPPPPPPPLPTLLPDPPHSPLVSSTMGVHQGYQQAHTRIPAAAGGASGEEE